ncbi:MAG: shikimate dehydrogenase [Bacteroidetes bacterium OLB11]|nr:MAG: shikimate dehydrogenase [Bacteroidetes bacterium OLB11]
MNNSYSNFPIQDLRNIRSVIAPLDLEGFNVTYPHKESIINYLDDLSDEAKKIGAVNCVKIIDDLWIGYNTDAFGFEVSLRQFIPKSFKGTALIIGNGGAANAVRFVLQKLQIPYQSCNRTEKKDCISFDKIDKKLIGQHQLIIQTTPLGMGNLCNSYPPIPYEALTPNHYAFDLVYVPSKTLFLMQCELHHATIKNGFEMLILQADKSYEIWNS